MLVPLLQLRNWFLEMGCCCSRNLKGVSRVVSGGKTEGGRWNDGDDAIKGQRHILGKIVTCSILKEDRVLTEPEL